METTVPTKTDHFVASLYDIQRTPFGRMHGDQVADVVRRVVHKESDAVAIDVAAFSSSI